MNYLKSIIYIAKGTHGYIELNKNKKPRELYNIVITFT